MDLFQRRLGKRNDVTGRLDALEDYVEYLRQQGEYGFGQTQRKERQDDEQKR